LVAFWHSHRANLDSHDANFPHRRPCGHPGEKAARGVALRPAYGRVRDRRIYLAPNLSYGWFDAPPGVNRLIGVRSLLATLYPRPESIRDTTRQFHKLFYQVDLTDQQLDTLLTPATSYKKEQ
jgi:hypothetical protein